MWIKFFTSLNVLIFRLSNGRLGNKMGKQSVLLLYTVGRRSGKRYITTLSYYRDGENYLVVASNWGKESHPGWYYNLLGHPETSIQVGSKVMHVRASSAGEQDYQRLWELVTTKNQQYIAYQKGLQRRIPIMVLAPSSSTSN